MTVIVHPEKPDPDLLDCPAPAKPPRRLIVDPAATDAEEHEAWVEPLRATLEACHNDAVALRKYFEAWPKP